MARPTIFPLKKDNNGAQLISRLNQLISITESLTTLTSVQRQELVKLFPLSNLRTPGRSNISTPNLQIRKYGIFHDRVSNLSPSISTQSMFEVAPNRKSKDISRMLLPDQEQKSSDESELRKMNHKI
ncbi:hypothetical protein FOB64_005298 [Candida albicans]|uniref:Uncharacterized protein n=1 Tax=Candida albicans TaxID=5476 RepID=A0A8H6BTA8_CANAX|nr:hypothetical protein FOB64_005298 [Candida albicans]